MSSFRLKEYGARLTYAGHIVTEMTIPYDAFQGLWYMDSAGTWTRLMNRSTETLIVKNVKNPTKQE